MALNRFNVTYDDFKLDDIINPDEFNINFEDIMIRLNQIIDVLNQITDGIGGDGAEIVHVGEVLPFTSDRLQNLLQELVDQLRSTDEPSGSDFIGSARIPGLDGNTVQEQLFSLKNMIDDFRAQFEAEVTRLDADMENMDARINELDDDIVLLQMRTSDLEGRVAIIQVSKPDRSEVYTRAQSDSKLYAELRDYYTKYAMDSILSGKTDKLGDHAGTWQGVDISDFSDILGISDLHVGTSQPANPKEGLLWYNPVGNAFQIYSNGTWRIQAKPTQIKKVHNRVELTSDSSEVEIGIDGFNPALDAFIVAQNSVFVAEGYEYNVSPDGLKIVHPNGSWASGTVFDFTAFISVPLLN